MSKGANCGLSALEKITALKNVSMLTLIHLAKDNGITLYFCQVERDDLIKVQRPAILHQKDHFVFVEDGKPFPPGEYDGYVLTPKQYNEPLPHSVARRVQGGKSGGFLSPIVTGLGFVLGGPIGGALAGAGMGALQASGAMGDEGKNQWWRVGTGALSGGFMGSSPTISALSAAAGEVPGAVKSGNWLAPVSAGLGQYGASVFAGGARGGLEAATAAGKGVFGKTTSAIQGGWGALTGAPRTGSGVSTSSGVEAASKAAGGSVPSTTSYTDSFRLTGALPGRTAAGSMTNLPGIGETQFGSQTSNILKFAAGANQSQGAGNILSSFMPQKTGMGTLSNLQLLGTALSTAIPSPTYERDMGANYSRAAQYLGGDNWNALPSATRQQLTEYTNMSLEDLSTKLTESSDKGLRLLEEQQQAEIDAISTQYANYGQDPYTSTDAQQRITEINRQYDQAKAEYQQQVQYQGMQQAVDFKKQILTQAINQNFFDQQSFMELAAYYGMDQEAEYALESNNYEAMQEVLAKIFQLS